MTQDPRFPVETDVRDVGYLDASLFQTVLHGLVGKAAVMLPPGKALLFGRGDNFAIMDERRSRIAERG